MFTVYHSNSPELFTKLVVNIISNNRLLNPMQSEIILIENKIMERWIEIELANYFGIAANIMFMNIMSFMKKISLGLLPNNSLTNTFSYDFMYWKFMEILPKVQLDKDCSVIKKYLEHDVNQQKYSQLSIQLTDLFLEYLIYRIDWLDTWQLDKIVKNLDFEDQIWQLKIWNMFLEHTKCSVQELSFLHCSIFLLQQKLKKNDFSNLHLPNRVFVYSVTSIPPLYWKFLDLLSCYIDIYLWLISPCTIMQNNIACLLRKQSSNIRYEYNNQLCSTSASNCIDFIVDNCNFHKSQNYCVKSDHPLINSWGSIGIDTMILLNKCKNVFEIKSFVIPKEDSMLHILQKDILEHQKFISDFKKNQFCDISLNKQKYILQPHDESIQIHVCYNIQREIEILHDNLLSILSDDSSLSPGDIIVVAPNIHDYTAAIETVFNNIFDRKLPFSISSDYSKQYKYSIISSFFKILDIYRSRFTSEEVLSFLSVPSIASRFDITIEEIKLLKKWVIESGIRWGLDERTINNCNLCMIDQNTWDAGFKRMLLGYAMRSQHGVWENICPYDCFNEEHVQLISRFGKFLETLKKWRNRLSCDHTLKDWIPYIQEIIDDFFCCSHLNSKETEILFFLKICWINILESGISLGYAEMININMIKDQLNRKFYQKKMYGQFLPNAINFCEISSIYYIPYKVLCCIGMNSVFPRNIILRNFNLMAKESRCGDGNIWEKDCYSFLLAILLAKKKLYISFIKNSTYSDNITNCKSILIDEILEYIAKNFYFMGDHKLNFISNIERIRNYLFRWHSDTSFDYNNFIPNSQTQSFAKEWVNSAKVNVKSSFAVYSCFSNLLPSIGINTILVEDLCNFYRHPVRMWFQKRLGVYFDYDKYQVFNNEPFITDDVYRFELNTKLLNYFIYDKNTDFLYEQINAAGKLPHGAFSDLYWMKQYEQMSALANQIKMYYFNQVYNLNISLNFNDIKLHGCLYSVQKNGLIRWKPYYLSMKDHFLLWLEHLIYCASGGSGDSRLFGINSICHFPNFSELQSKKLLFPLISGYYKGMDTPLLLLYKTGGIWMNQVFSWKDRKIRSEEIYQNRARQKLIEAWKGSNQYSFFNGEHCDPYLRKLIPLDLDEENIQQIIKISRDYFFNIMNYRIL